MRRGIPLYIALLGLLREPATTRQVSAALHCALVNIRHTLRLMRHYELVRVAGWVRRTDGGGIPAVTWVAGHGAEPVPDGCAKAPKDRATISSEMIVFVGLVRALNRGPLTALELAADTGLLPATLYTSLRQMREAGLLHIGCWDRSKRIPQAAYVWGQGADAPRPKAEAKRSIELRYYAKKKARKEQGRLMRALAANASVFNTAQRA